MPEKEGMKSLAKNRSTIEESPKEPYYPSMVVPQKSLPGLKNAKVDDTGYMLVEYKVKGVEKYGNGEITVSLDILKGKITKEEESKE